MTIKDMMRYVESEYNIINNTPCEICGGKFIAQEFEMDFQNGITYDTCNCTCSSCGYEKVFKFYAPFIEEDSKEDNNLN